MLLCLFREGIFLFKKPILPLKTSVFLYQVLFFFFSSSFLPSFCLMSLLTGHCIPFHLSLDSCVLKSYLVCSKACSLFRTHQSVPFGTNLMCGVAFSPSVSSLRAQWEMSEHPGQEKPSPVKSS